MQGVSSTVYIGSFLRFLIFSNRTTATYHLSSTLGITASVEETYHTKDEYIPLQGRNDWVGSLTLLVVGALLCVPVIMFCLKIKMQGKQRFLFCVKYIMPLS